PHTSPHDPALMDASATNVWAGSVRVCWESSQHRPKADGWPDVNTRWGNPPTSHRGNSEGQRSGPTSTTPSPRRRHKPKIPNAWGDGSFILNYKPAERSSPHAFHNTAKPSPHGGRAFPHARPEASAVIHLTAHQF